MQDGAAHPLYGIKLDFSKFFDTLPWGVLVEMLTCLGADCNFVATYSQWLRSTWYRYKLRHRALGIPWQRQRGLTQGCPLSPACSNVLTIPFVRDLQDSLQKLGVEAHIFLYLDDFTVVGADPRIPTLTWQCAQRYAQALHLQLHVREGCPGKTGVFASGLQDRIVWEQAQFLPVGLHLEALGKVIALQDQQVIDPMDGMLEVQRRADRVGLLPLSAERKAGLMAT